jgi:hypothetical protein
MSVPAGRPLWSAISRMSTAPTLPCQPCAPSASVLGAPTPDPTEIVPQVPIALPATAEPPMPLTAVPVKSPVPAVESALAFTLAATAAIVTSPPRIVRPLISAEAAAVAVGDPLELVALRVIEPLVTIEPSPGYEKPPIVVAESFGAET